MILYNLLYNFLRYTLLAFSPILNKKTKAWIQLRNNNDLIKAAVSKTSSPRVWIHASSGEIEYAKSFIREYKKTNLPFVPDVASA